MVAAWVYVLRCADGSLYTGWTNDLERRFARHRAGKASRYTASRLPVEMAAAWPMPDRRSAMREEAKIKRLDRRAKIALIGQPARERGGQAVGYSPEVGRGTGRGEEPPRPSSMPIEVDGG